MIANDNLPRFSLGQLVATPAALEALQKAGQSPAEFLARHQIGDWGEVDNADKKANDEALVNGERLLSAYRTRLGTKLWIITDVTDDNGQRPVSTLLLPSE